MDRPQDKPLPPIVPSVNSVPADVMNELHAANDNFHEQKQQVDASMNDNKYSHQTGVAAATEKLRQAEHDVEAADEKVKDALKK